MPSDYERPYAPSPEPPRPQDTRDRGLEKEEQDDSRVVIIDIGGNSDSEKKDDKNRGGVIINMN